MQAFGRFLDVLDALRKNCPWDRKQTNESPTSCCTSVSMPRLPRRRNSSIWLMSVMPLPER